MLSVAADTKVPEFVALDQASFRVDLSDPARSVSQAELQISQGPGASVVALAEQALGSAVPSVESVLEEMVGPAERDTKRFPASARAHFNLGLALMNAGRAQQAGVALQQAQRLEPDNPKIGYQYARSLLAIGERQEARRLFTHLLEASPSDWTLLCGLAECALGEGDYPRAADTWTKVIELRPHWPDGHYYRGLALLLADSSSRHLAIRDLRAATKLDPRRPAFYHGLGVGFAVAGDLKRAERELRIALRLKPGFSEALEALTTVLLQGNRLEDASAILSRRLKEEPANLRLLELAAWAHVTRGRPADAKTYLHRALGVIQETGRAPIDLARVANNLGVCSARSHHWDEALRLFRRALEVSPDYSPIAYQNLALAMVEVNRAADAVDPLRECLRRFPESEGARIILAGLLVEQEKAEEGLSILRDWVQSGHAGAPAYASYGAQLADRSAGYDEAIRVLRQGMERFNDESVLINNLAYVQLMSGMTAAARQTLESSASGTPDKSIYLRATWGLLNLREGQIEEGIRCYEQAASEADRRGEPRVASDVRLKMHVEVARAYVEADRVAEAKREIELGKRVPGRATFKRDLEALASRLSSADRP